MSVKSSFLNRLVEKRLKYKRFRYSFSSRVKFEIGSLNHSTPLKTCCKIFVRSHFPSIGLFEGKPISSLNLTFERHGDILYKRKPKR